MIWLCLGFFQGLIWPSLLVNTWQPWLLQTETDATCWRGVGGEIRDK